MCFVHCVCRNRANICCLFFLLCIFSSTNTISSMLLWGDNVVDNHESRLWIRANLLTLHIWSECWKLSSPFCNVFAIRQCFIRSCWRALFSLSLSLSFYLPLSLSLLASPSHTFSLSFSLLLLLRWSKWRDVKVHFFIMRTEDNNADGLLYVKVGRCIVFFRRKNPK